MSYRIIVPESVEKQLSRIPAHDYQRIRQHIKELAENPRPIGSLKLKGVEGEYRIRVGDYRVRYSINDAAATVSLISCKHRKEVYRD